MNKKFLPYVCILMLLLLAPGLTPAAAHEAAQEAALTGVTAPLASAFTYQGTLTDSAGKAVSGACDFQFSLYDAASAGVQVGTTQEQVITVSGGQFTASLDFGSTAFNGSARWLQIAVCCPAGSGSYAILSPRQPLTPAPYASYSVKAGTVPWSGVTGKPAQLPTGCSTDQIAKWNGSAWVCSPANNDHNHLGGNWTGTGTGLTLSGGTIGLAVHGSVTGVNAYTSGAGGMGVYGRHSAPSGNGYGLFGEASSSSAYGVYGRAPVTGIMGVATNTSCGAAGVYGISSSVNAGYGVLGKSTATTGTGYGVGGINEAPVIIGKALEGLAEDVGVILVLISLQ